MVESPTKVKVKINYTKVDPSKEFYLENREIIEELKEQIGFLNKNIKYSLNNDGEEEFLSNNKNKFVTLMLKNEKEITGILVDIGPYGIFINDNNIIKYYYKHSVVGYFVR